MRKESHLRHAHIVAYGAEGASATVAPVAATGATVGWSISSASHLWVTNCNEAVAGKLDSAKSTMHAFI